MVELFGKTALIRKLSFHLPELPIREKVGLVNESHHGICRDFGGSFFDKGLISRIRPIGHIGEPSNGFRLRVVLCPERKLVLSQEIFIVEQQLLQGRPGHADQIEFGLFGGAEAMLPSAMFCLPLRAACTI